VALGIRFEEDPAQAAAGKLGPEGVQSAEGDAFGAGVGKVRGEKGVGVGAGGVKRGEDVVLRDVEMGVAVGSAQGFGADEPSGVGGPGGSEAGAGGGAGFERDDVSGIAEGTETEGELALVGADIEHEVDTMEVEKRAKSGGAGEFAEFVVPADGFAGLEAEELLAVEQIAEEGVAGVVNQVVAEGTGEAASEPE